MIKNAIFFFGYTLASVAGLLILKSNLLAAKQALTTSFVLSPLLLVGVGSILYIVGFGIWLMILSRMDLSTAYPIAVGLTLVFTSLAGGLLLGEAITVPRAFGIVMIFAGIIAVTR
jgi:multidrug transporter EmrE-like cation transporter